MHHEEWMRRIWCVHLPFVSNRVVVAVSRWFLFLWLLVSPVTTRAHTSAGGPPHSSPSSSSGSSVVVPPHQHGMVRWGRVSASFPHHHHRSITRPLASSWSDPFSFSYTSTKATRQRNLPSRFQTLAFQSFSSSSSSSSFSCRLGTTKTNSIRRSTSYSTTSKSRRFVHSFLWHPIPTSTRRSTSFPAGPILHSRQRQRLFGTSFPDLPPATPSSADHKMSHHKNNSTTTAPKDSSSNDTVNPDSSFPVSYTPYEQ